MAKVTHGQLPAAAGNALAKPTRASAPSIPPK